MICWSGGCGCWKDGTPNRVPGASTPRVSRPPKPAATAASMGGKKVTGRKRHIVVDSQGHLLRVKVHAADVPDGEGAREVLYWLGRRWPQLRLLWADSHYGGEDLADWVLEELDV